MPEISIIVATYNGEDFIRETLGSLLSQTFEDFEIVVVDDGSTDSTAKIVRSFEDERIKYFHKENSGNQAIPRNYGIKKSEGEYIAFCDQDDIWYPEKLEKQIAAIEGKRDPSTFASMVIGESVGMTHAPLQGAGQAKGVGIIVSSADIINEKGTKVGIRYVPEGYMSAKESFETLLDEDFITACSAIVPRKVLDEIGPLNEKLSGNDDYDMWLRITRKYGIYGISEPLCTWRRTEKSYSKDMSRIFLENEKIFKELKPENEAERDSIGKGSNKNLVRLFVAYVKEEKYAQAKEVLTKIQLFEDMAKVKLIMKIFKISPGLARTVALAFHKIKKEY